MNTISRVHRELNRLWGCDQLRQRQLPRITLWGLCDYLLICHPEQKSVRGAGSGLSSQCALERIGVQDAVESCQKKVTVPEEGGSLTSEQVSELPGIRVSEWALIHRNAFDPTSAPSKSAKSRRPQRRRGRSERNLHFRIPLSDWALRLQQKKSRKKERNLD